MSFYIKTPFLEIIESPERFSRSPKKQYSLRNIPNPVTPLDTTHEQSHLFRCGAICGIIVISHPILQCDNGHQNV